MISRITALITAALLALATAGVSWAADGAPQDKTAPRPGERVESFFTHVPIDVIAITYNGSGFIAAVPPGILKLDDPGLENTVGILAKFRDKDGKIIGFGTQLELPTDTPDGDAGIERATDWILVLPGRGKLYLSEIEHAGTFGEEIIKPCRSCTA